MGQKDISEKLFEDYNDVFADIVNVLLFDGQEVVLPDSLSDLIVHSQYKSDDRKLHELERDVAKCWLDGKTRIALYGIENQTKADPLMPVRVIGYDGASYRSQITTGNTEILPVITLVLYFGKERWNKGKSLKEAIKIPTVVDPYVTDYSIHIFEVSWLSEKQISLFKSDFRLVADFFVKRRIDPNYIPQDKTEIRHIDGLLKLLSAFTGDHRYEEIMANSKPGEMKNMCEVMDRCINKGREEERKILFSLVADGDLSIEKAAEKTGISVNEFKRQMNDAGYKPFN